MKKRLFCSIISVITFLPLFAQKSLSLEECRNLAIQNNRQLKISKLTTAIAENIHKATKTKYLPKITAMAGYEHFTREISLLNDRQKDKLSNLGSNLAGKIGTGMDSRIANLLEQGFISEDAANQLSQTLNDIVSPLAQAGNNIGNQIRQSFNTNSKNMYIGSIILTQPIYMGGGIKAANELATIGEDLVRNNIELKRQLIIYGVDNAYWLAVSLKKKEELATQYYNLTKHLCQNVQKMYKAGVATKADILKIEVATNTAELIISEIGDGISLAKMALCELCGIELNENLRLADEATEDISTSISQTYNLNDTTLYSRPEIRILQNTVDITKQNTKIINSLYKPHLALTAGYTVANPNTFNGFEHKFRDIFNIGIVLHIPVFNWGEAKYKNKAAQISTAIAKLELNDIRNKIQLEIKQNNFRLITAKKRLAIAKKNMLSAEENLRVANIGFKEGVLTLTEVMAAQTAWLSAKTAIIDAEISIRTAYTGLKKALGKL